MQQSRAPSSHAEKGSRDPGTGFEMNRLLSEWGLFDKDWTIPGGSGTDGGLAQPGNRSFKD